MNTSDPQMAAGIKQLFLAMDNPRTPIRTYTTSKIVEHFGAENLIPIFDELLDEESAAHQRFGLQELAKLKGAASECFDRALALVDAANAELAGDAIYCLVSLDKARYIEIIPTLKNEDAGVSDYLKRQRKRYL